MASVPNKPKRKYTKRVQPVTEGPERAIENGDKARTESLNGESVINNVLQEVLEGFKETMENVEEEALKHFLKTHGKKKEISKEILQKALEEIEKENQEETLYRVKSNLRVMEHHIESMVQNLKAIRKKEKEIKNTLMILGGALMSYKETGDEFALKHSCKVYQEFYERNHC